ncbi:hypothetical protein LCGC14_0719030 [marine sediment metagenome]|uniref:Uncharacterized protein n=1 Tax=marine sediment metagenome TaxID=412755 RepID=A0A0F9TKD4_9ZZZZ
MQTRPVVFADVHREILHGSPLLWRGGRFLDGPLNWMANRLISGPDRSDWSHVGRVQVDTHGRLWSLEFLQFRGPVRKDLAEYVQFYPGRIDVFAPDVHRFRGYRPALAVAEMQDLMVDFRGRYGWRNILRAGVSRVPGLRLLAGWSTDDQANGHRPPHCSDAASRCDFLAGVDPVPNTPSWATTPADFGRSLLYQYQFTLYWSADQISNTGEMAA